MTDNHDYNTPAEGATDWHVPLNENFEELDVDVEVRDVEANRSNYDPKAGAAFLETDSGIVYLGDGSSWVPALSVGRTERGQSNGVDGVNVVMGHPVNATTSGVVGATIGGGGGNSGNTPVPNEVTGDWGTVGGGRWNGAGSFATVAGGSQNYATGKDSTISGGITNGASGSRSTVGGGTGNSASGKLSSVGGGGANRASAEKTTVAGGQSNVAKSAGAAVGGGQGNENSGDFGTVGGGWYNEVAGTGGTIGGGQGNEATVQASTVAGGSSNSASADMSTVGGGAGNEANGAYATAPGGYENTAGGQYSFAAGRKAKADANGAFVWADSSSQLVRSTVGNEFKVQAGGGVVFYSKSDLTSGVSLAAGSGSWSSSSSRDAKEDLRSIDPGDVLEGVRGLDVSTWRYAAQDDGTRHMGPMAEDFHDAFGLGEDERQISTVDADGVAFAAIQGLADRQDEQVLAMEELREENARLRRENEELDARLDALEERVAADAGAG